MLFPRKMGEKMQIEKRRKREQHLLTRTMRGERKRGKKKKKSERKGTKKQKRKKRKMMMTAQLECLGKDEEEQSQTRLEEEMPMDRKRRWGRISLTSPCLSAG